MYDQLTAKNVIDVIQTLAHHASNKEIESRPLVTLSLTSGGHFQGQILDYKNGDLLMKPVNANEVIYLSAHGVCSVVVHHPEAWAPALSDGKVDPLSFEPRVGSLDLKRKIQAATAVLTNLLGGDFAIDVDWDSIPPDSELAPKTIQAFVDDFVSALTRLAADDTCKQMILDRFQSLVLKHGDSRGVTAGQSSIEVVYPTEGSLAERFDANALFSLLNGLF